MNVIFDQRIQQSTRTKFLEQSKKITRCPSCKNVHYKGVWYAPDSRFALLLDEKKDSFVQHICPACAMQKEGRYAGVLYVKDVPKKIQQPVESLLFTAAKHDYFNNPQHRIVEFSEIMDGYKVTTTSAAMAARMGEKIQALFGACSMHSTYQQVPGAVAQVIKVTFMTAV
jgi:NMD protein affecting ribosome stability and mRNA decay